MTNATTSAVWRSTGGDQTRTASAGSMVMSVPFYIANIAATSNVVASSTDSSTVILPANAVVTVVSVTTAATGSIDLGFTPLIGVGPGQTTTLGTKVPQGFLANATTTSRVTIATGGTGGGASLGNVANATNLVVVTSAANGTSSGTVSGRIIYHVADAGQQSV